MSKKPRLAPVVGRLPGLTVWVAGARRLALRRPRLTVAVAVVLVVALVGVGVRSWVTRDHDGPGWARSPHSAVQGYLTAVADGRASDALAYLSSPPVDRTFLTDAVLAQSRRLAPMTGIVVGDISGPNSSGKKCGSYGCTVQVEYRLGDRKTEVRLEVSEREGGYWFIGNQPQTVDLVGDRDYDSIGRYKVAVLVNGTPLPVGAGTATLFPGRYRATSDDPLVDIDSTFTVEPPATGRWVDDLHVPLHPTLTADGKRRIAQAAQDQLDACLAQTSFATECGFLDIDDSWFDGPADPTTISWAVVGDATLPEPDGKLYGQYGVDAARTGVVVVVPIEIQPRCTWTTVAGRPQDWEPYMAPNYYVADLADPDRIAVDFVYL